MTQNHKSGLQMELRELIMCSLFAALISVCAYISVITPFSTVPFTAQTLAIMLTGSILKPKHAFISVGVFILLGIVGLPVFSGGGAGLPEFIKRAGYLVGFLFGALIISLLRGKKNNIFRIAISNILGGIIVVYTLGVAWRVLGLGIPFKLAVWEGAIIFIPWDLLKVFLATSIAFSLNKQLGRVFSNEKSIYSSGT
ncbi:MAG: biotin transporter BioY [Clostridia bacterium]|nr:biotin transporter BioY [Clostridia bacterium]